MDEWIGEWMGGWGEGRNESEKRRKEKNIRKRGENGETEARLRNLFLRSP